MGQFRNRWLHLLNYIWSYKGQSPLDLKSNQLCNVNCNNSGLFTHYSRHVSQNMWKDCPACLYIWYDGWITDIETVLKMSCFISFQDFYLGCIQTASTMDSGVTVVSDPVVTIRITSTISPFETEKRFMRSITIAEFKVGLLIIHPMSDRMHKLAMASSHLVFFLKKDTC